MDVNKISKQLETETLTRISYILGIYKALHTIYSDDVADEWLQRPNSNTLFKEQQPIELLISGDVNNLRIIREHLDARLQIQ